MKNKILKIVLFIIIALAIGTVASNATIVANNPTVQSGENVTINITSQELIDGYKTSISSNSGLNFLSATGGTLQQGQVISGVSLSGMKSLATYNFKAPEVSKDTTYKVTFLVEGIILHGTEQKTSTTISSTITVKAKEAPKPPTGGDTGNNQSGNTGSNNGTTNKPTVTEPKFTSASKTVYAKTDVNLRSSWSTSSSAVKVKKGTELRLTGTSTEKINGYIWYRVTYNGQIKYIAKDYITETKPEEKSNNANLKSLSVEGVELTPAFSTNITEYSAKLINYTEKEIKVTAQGEDTKTSVVVEGNKNIIIGENAIIVKATAEDGTTKIYTITLTNEEKIALALQTLKIKDIELKNFIPNKFEYEVAVPQDLEKLEIEAIANAEGALVEILGNENLNVGENLITIIVTSADEKETVTYQIKANKLERVAQEENKQLNVKNLLICGTIAIVVIIIIIILIVKYIKNGENSNIDYMYDDNLENNENEPEVTEEKSEEMKEKDEKEIEENVTEKQHEKTKVDELLDDYEEESPRKKGKGKHSR